MYTCGRFRVSPTLFRLFGRPNSDGVSLQAPHSALTSGSAGSSPDWASPPSSFWSRQREFHSDLPENELIELLNSRERVDLWAQQERPTKFEFVRSTGVINTRVLEDYQTTDSRGEAELFSLDPERFTRLLSPKYHLSAVPMADGLREAMARDYVVGNELETAVYYDTPANSLQRQGKAIRDKRSRA